MDSAFSPEIIFTFVQGIFFILLFFFTLHTVFLTYHWFTYGSSKHISLVALTIYLSGGAILLLTFSVALNTLPV